MNTEHTDMHDRTITETADTAMTYVNGIMGITGMTEREWKNVFKRLGVYPRQQRAPFKCDQAFIAAACNAGGRKFCLVSIALSPAGTDQFVAERSVFVRLTYRRL